MEYMTKEEALQKLAECSEDYGYIPPSDLIDEWVSDPVETDFRSPLDMPRKGGHERIQDDATIVAFQVEERGWIVGVLQKGA